MRASDGALVAVRIRGTTTDAESLCPEVARDLHRSTDPRACNHGEFEHHVRWICAGGVPE